MTDKQLELFPAGTPTFWYVYAHPDKHGLQGVVCKLPSGKLGYAWACKKDLPRASKKMARKIAEGRALRCDVYRTPTTGTWVCTRNGTYRKVPEALWPLLEAI